MNLATISGLVIAGEILCAVCFMMIKDSRSRTIVLAAANLVLLHALLISHSSDEIGSGKAVPLPTLSVGYNSGQESKHDQHPCPTLSPLPCPLCPTPPPAPVCPPCIASPPAPPPSSIMSDAGLSSKAEVGPSDKSELWSFLKTYFRNVQPADTGHWLTIGIPSRTRPDAETHRAILESLFQSLRQDSLPPKDRSVVLVVNNEPMPGAHPALQPFQNNASFPHVRIVENYHLETMLELKGGWKQGNLIPHPVQQQMLDVISMLMIAYRQMPYSGLFMFHEDDFVACSGAVPAIRRAVQQAQQMFRHCTSSKSTEAKHNGLKFWRALRLTYGLAGIIVPAAALPSVAFYMLQRIENVPVDHAMVEWALGAGSAPWQSDACPYFVNRHNLFEHSSQGDRLSTFQWKRTMARGSWFPSCHEELNNSKPIFRAEEYFDAVECPPSAEVWPCAATVLKRKRAKPELYEEDVELAEVAAAGRVLAQVREIPPKA